jgi:hypothetical protein
VSRGVPISPAEARAILRAYRAGEPCARTAARWGCHPSTITHVALRLGAAPRAPRRDWAPGTRVGCYEVVEWLGKRDGEHNPRVRVRMLCCGVVRVITGIYAHMRYVARGLGIRCRDCTNEERHARARERPRRCTGCDTDDRDRFAHHTHRCVACDRAWHRNGPCPGGCGRPVRFSRGGRPVRVPCACGDTTDPREGRAP